MDKWHYRWEEKYVILIIELTVGLYTKLIKASIYASTLAKFLIKNVIVDIFF